MIQFVTSTQLLSQLYYWAKCFILCFWFRTLKNFSSVIRLSFCAKDNLFTFYFTLWKALNLLNEYLTVHILAYCGSKFWFWLVLYLNSRANLSSYKVSWILGQIVRRFFWTIKISFDGNFWGFHYSQISQSTQNHTNKIYKRKNMNLVIYWSTESIFEQSMLNCTGNVFIPNQVWN